MKFFTQPLNRSTPWLIFSLFFCLFLCPTFVNARRFSPFSMPVGAKTTINGREVIKVTKTGKFVDLAKWKALGNTTMQGWDDCASLATPTGTNFTQGPILTDIRDGKQYEIRKFADGKCWMVDNLMYGGDADACAGKSTFAGNGSVTPSNQFGAGTYGDCRDPRVGGTAPCTAGSTVCGYYYNWQAAMQHASAYLNAVYSGSIANVQGLCPENWRLPTGNNGGDFFVLHNVAGLPKTGFWQLGDSWKGPFSGICYSTGGLVHQGSSGWLWSSNPYNEQTAYLMNFYSNSVYPSDSNNKNLGLSIRCLKN